MSDTLDTPVALFIFNRPLHTAQSFQAIREQKPRCLFVVADGPRFGRADDLAGIRAAREVVAAVDWPCEVRRLFADHNMGCKRRVSTGLKWVFSHVERAIVLEDDCIASPEFFAFCETLLERYADDERVWVINGNSFQPEHRRADAAYYFSRYAGSWGWATWARAWRNYDGDLAFLPAWQRSPAWNARFPARAERTLWARVFRDVRRGRLDSWAYAWMACVHHANALAANPNANLVKNIGFDEQATHTRDAARYMYDITPLGVLTHPVTVTADEEADWSLFSQYFAAEASFTRRLLRWARRKVVG
jgi:hypothetical protein